MREQIFETAAHAKCILAGEHAVLHGSPAIVTPIPDKLINLRYKASNQPVQVECDSVGNESFQKFFLEILHHGCKLLNLDPANLCGQFYCHNNILMGAGIGFSSALCVVISRWFVWQQMINKHQLFEFARNLENSIHGKSSGLDVVGAMANHVTHFDSTGNFYEIKVVWQPKLFVSYSGFKKNTAEAIKHVTTFNKNNLYLSEKIFLEMKQSVLTIEQSITSNAKLGLPLLIKGINQANECFQAWELITPEFQKYMDMIQDLGALAVKPTGAGLGGYVLSLWEHVPPQEEIEFLPVCF